MPRVHSLPARERDIAVRLKSLRKLAGLSRQAFSMMYEDAIARVELLRMPLRFELAERIWLRNPTINPLYLANGEGPPHLTFKIYLPRVHEIGATPGELFSAVIDRFTAELRTLWGTEDASALPLSWLNAQDDLTKHLKEAVDEATFILSRHEYRVARWRTEAKKKLTNAESGSKTNVVKSQLPNLIERLKKATAKSGKKSELANALKPKVPLASVSRWLSGEREPGGEVALQLLTWVEEQERQK